VFLNFENILIFLVLFFLIKVHRIVNSPITSNCYVISSLEMGSSCIVVDPGSNDNQLLIDYINSNCLIVKDVILTHEHFDHIAGVIDLHSKYKLELICSIETAKGIGNSKKNLSAFNDQIRPVEIQIIPSIVKDNEQIIFGNSKLCFYNTPGHSTGSMCFSIDNYFFTGDTLLYNRKTRLNLPGSNKEHFAETIKKLIHVMKPGMQVCPGHGHYFVHNVDQFITFY